MCALLKISARYLNAQKIIHPYPSGSAALFCQVTNALPLILKSPYMIETAMIYH